MPYARKGEPDGRKQVELLGLDVFDPADDGGEPQRRRRRSGMVSGLRITTGCASASHKHFSRARTEWDKLKKALKGEFDEAVWAHLAGTVSAPFEPGENKRIAVKVIDDRGNELLVVRTL